VLSAGPAFAESVAAFAALVLDSSPELRGWTAEIAAARAGRAAAAARSNPDVSASLGMKSADEGDVSDDGFAWSVSLDQPVEFRRRRALRQALADHEIAIAEAGLDQFRRASAARVRALALDLEFARQREAAAGDVARRAEQILDELRQREPAGLVPLLETRTLEGHVAALHQRAAAARIDGASALAALNALAGRPAAQDLQLTGVAPKLAPLPDEDVLVAAAREAGFDVQLARLEVERRRTDAELSRRDAVTGYTVSPFAEGEEIGEATELTVGIGLSMPWAIWNKNAAGIAAAEARLAQAEAELATRERDVRVSVAEHAAAYAAAHEALAGAAGRQVEALREAVELGDRHYRVGAVPLTSYLDLHAQYLDALEAVLETRRRAASALLQLETLTGLSLTGAEGSAP
jgi:cobalt-zinc-cadmium efflux system outer membrane protein